VRSLLLFLSRQNRLRKWVEGSAAAQRLATRFVAGSTLEEALDVCRALNQEGITVTLDRLGESVTSLDEAAEAREGYMRALGAIRDSGIRGNVSLKLTQFGLDLSYERCKTNVEQLISCAASMKTFVRVDMEDSRYTDLTLNLVRDLHAAHGSVGVVIQAYLYRSRADIERLNAERIRVRLCKGAYLEPPEVAFPRKKDVDENFIELMRLLLENGEYPAIATHDERMIAETKSYAAMRKIPPDSFEFQMLYGIRRDLQRRLVAEGYRLRLYVPFGRAWYPYYMRRLAERPANVLFIARNLLRQ
jgi:proline dehydrogenase